MAKDNHKGNGLSLLLAKNILNGLNYSLKNTVSTNNYGNKNSVSQKIIPAQDPIQVLNDKVEKLESLLNFYSDLYHQSPDFRKIKVEKKITKRIFYEKYYFKNRPVIIKEMLANCDALRKWSPDYFLQRFGSIPIQVTRRRESNPEYEKSFYSTLANITVREFIKLIIENPDSNDLYLVARNYFFSNPNFESLKEDLKPFPSIIDSSCEGTNVLKLWFGPKGTVTPFHHDKHSILFAQIYGRKQFKMIPSFELNKMYNVDRYYSEVDPEKIDKEKYPEFLETSLSDVILEPGDLLFIPAGWWHWVRSLDISISVTFSNFFVKDFNTEWKCK